MNFESVELGNYIKVQGGYAYKSNDFNDDGDFPVIKIKNVRFGDIDYSEASHISNELAMETADWKTKEGDILISMTGSGPNAPNSLVGRVARIWEGEPDAWINQRVGRILLNGEKEIHPDFIYYLLSSSDIQHYLVSNSTGSANQANISGKLIESVPCPEVDFETSKRIASQLKGLDQKIRLNQQTNKTLEATAQAIFKSWFVDFDPVRAKIAAKKAGRCPNRAAMAAIAGVPLEKSWDEIDAALCQKLSRMTEEQQQQLARTAEFFPDELVEVPKGWEVNRIDELGEVVTGKTPPTKNPENYGEDVPFLTIPDMHGNIFAIETSKYLSKKGADTQKKKYLPAGSISMSCIASPGLVILNHRQCHTNQQINTLIPDEIEYSCFYFFLLRELSDEVIMKGSGGSVFKNLNKGQFSSLKVRLPEKKLRELFNWQVKPLMDKILQNSLESQRLRQLRDTLLPKLISGEVGMSKTTIKS